MNNNIRYVTVKSNEVICLALLCLRWPYKTIERIRLESQYYNLQTHRCNLDIYTLDELLFDGNDGFFLKLNITSFFHQDKFSDHLATFPNMFVLKNEIEDIERRKTEYTLYPAGRNYDASTALCSYENLNRMAPKIIYACCFGESNHVPYPEPETMEKWTLRSDRIWPWLGPIDPQLETTRVKRTVERDRKEIEGFVATARQLGQNDNSCLAKMTKHRFPEISRVELVDFIDKSHGGDNDAKKQQARRWLTRK